jgi:hypothetical protein
MQLSVIHELVIEENLVLLKSMGFDLRYNSDLPPTQRVQLVSLPQTDKLSLNVEGIISYSYDTRC